MLAVEGVRPRERLLEVAVEHASRRVPKAAPTQTARDVLASLIGQEFSSADDVAILDGHELVGLVPIERLMAAPGDATIAGIMDADPPVVDPGCDQEARPAPGGEETDQAKRDGSHGGRPPQHGRPGLGEPLDGPHLVAAPEKEQQAPGGHGERHPVAQG